MEIEGIENLEERDENERKAIEFVINEEIKENRKIKISSIREHYDILSIGSNPNDIRYIEVKGLKHFKNIMLSEIEFKTALKYKDRYHLYIVYDRESNNPKIVKIQNPIKKLKFKIMRVAIGGIVKRKEKVYTLTLRSFLKLKEKIESDKNDIDRL
ncbi:MAG: DUF3883 domain-containing protein [Nitrososphaerota archaeon]